MKPQHTATLNDIKTLFDGVKNLGLCAALALGLQGFQGPMETLGLSHNMRVMINFLGLGLSCALTAFAIVWLCFSFTQKPTSMRLYRVSLFMLGAVTLLVMFIIISSSWMKIPHEI